MNVLVNLLPIKSGGGQQVASNFINVLLEWQFETKFYFVATDSTHVSKILRCQNKYPFHIVKKGILNRIFFEKLYVKKIIIKYKIDIIYTLFGPSIINSDTINIAGCAYSNLFYPELNFWNLPIHKKFIKKIKDKYRLKKMLRADAVIFENDALKDRADKLYGLSNSTCIKPSISFSPLSISLKGKKQVGKIDKAKFNILMLTGWHSNKNLHFVPQILSGFKDKNVKNICFVLSLDQEEQRTRRLIHRLKEDSTFDMVKIIGTVNSSDVMYIAQNIDAFILLSNLESFSNNIIEAWYYKKPLIISDKDWSRSICGEAAKYVDISHPDRISDEIIHFVKDLEFQEQLVQNGSKELLKYPSPKLKVITQIKYLQSVYNEKQH